MAFSEKNKIVVGIKPDADVFAGTVRSDVVSLKNYNRATFIIDRGVGTTGTQVITINACDNFTPSNRTAIPFRYRISSTGDTWGAWQSATATGFTTAAGGSDMYAIEVTSSELPAARPNLELTSVEGVDAAVDAGVLIILSEPRYSGVSMPTAIA